MTKKAAATRVTYAEKAAREFLYWGYRRGDELPLSYPERVAWVHRWINLPTADNKLIDFTGCGHWGMSIAVESKRWDTRAGDGRFNFNDRISARQADFLTRNPGWSFLWLGAVVPSQDRRKINWRMFLIPWPAWLDMREKYQRQFKSAPDKAWQSISLPWIVYWFHPYELIEHAYRKNKKLVRAWFTQAEMKQPQECWVDGCPPVLPLAWRIPRNPKYPKPEDE